MRNATFSVELDKDRLTDEHDLRRMFFFHENKTSFSITRQISLTKENEWHCRFLDTAYLRVSYAAIHSAAQIWFIVLAQVYCELFFFVWCSTRRCEIWEENNATQGGGMGWESGETEVEMK